MVCQGLAKRQKQGGVCSCQSPTQRSLGDRQRSSVFLHGKSRKPQDDGRQMKRDPQRFPRSPQPGKMIDQKHFKQFCLLPHLRVQIFASTSISSGHKSERYEFRPAGDFTVDSQLRLGSRMQYEQRNEPQ